ncbi:MAG: ftsE [Clostridia bacterium]|jgi:cell division transport system ATP-binding protein|nr:ftsE [Clostridia bacterium]
MILFRSVSKTYKNGTEALRKIDLKIEDGEFVFIIGHSGAGKSTMVKLLMCEDVPTKGDVLVNNTNTRRLSSRQIPKYRRNLGVVFQDFRLIPSLNVYDNVAFAMRVVGRSNKDIRRRVASVLDLVDLKDKVHQMPGNLSGGEQQRVALARAIVNSPKVIIADEPTGNIDPTMSYEIMKLLNAINKSNITVIVVTHEQHLVNLFDKRVITLENGRILHDSKEDMKIEL